MKKLLILTLVLSQIALAGTATAVQLFDFDAQAIVPTMPGNAAEVYGVIVNGTAVDTPLPLDFANYQYTIVVTGLMLDESASTSQYSNGAIAIYEDAGTDADWSNTASFSDGKAILTGSLNPFAHTLFTATLGSGQGTVDWTGGTRLNDLAVSDQTGWPFLTGISRSSTQVLPGYTESWDGKVEPTEEVVAVEGRTWSGVKALYR